jgi:DNA-binding NarL/FixJ family response regulator
MRVLIVADNALAAEAIRRELRHAPNLRVIGYVDGRHPCGPAVGEANADVVVIDAMSDPDAALAGIGEIRASSPDTKIVLLTVRMDSAWLAQATAAGIDAAVAKTVHPASLGALIREVAAGNVFHTFESTPVRAPKPAPVDSGLTARELEILGLVAEGASNNRIACQLWVTEQTVKFHLSNVYRKLGVANRTEASHRAHVTGLLETAVRAADDAVVSVSVAA